MNSLFIIIFFIVITFQSNYRSILLIILIKINLSLVFKRLPRQASFIET
jgi:hypothetical protein